MTQEKEPPKYAANKRGRPFAKGSGGRPKGSRNKVTVLVEQLVAADAEKIVKVVIAKAKRGNMTAALAILRTILGPAKERGMPITFKLPALKNSADALAAIAAITHGVATGALDAEGARTLTALVGEFRNTVGAVDLERRLQALENPIGKTQ